MDIFVTQLRKAMFLKGMKQSDLSKATGYRDGKISAWYNGKYRPNAEAMGKIANAVGVTVDFLLGKEEVPVSKLTLPTFHAVDVLGKVAAGVPIALQEDVIGTVYTDKDVFGLKIKGDSMSPRITDGDIVLVKPQDWAEDGDVVIALVGDEVTCKVLKKAHKTVTLVPFNSVYAPLVYTEADDVKILGKVVESRHEW